MRNRANATTCPGTRHESKLRRVHATHSRSFLPFCRKSRGLSDVTKHRFSGNIRPKAGLHFRPIHLMQRARNRKRELRDQRIEGAAIFRKHLISPSHRADGGREARPARVLERLARL